MPKERAYEIYGNLTLPPDIWNDKQVFKVISAKAPSRTGLVAATMQTLVKSLGWPDAEMVAGLLVDWINRYPVEVRQIIVAGITEGLGMVYQKVEDEIQIDMVPLHDALEQGGERRTPGGLILPGGA
jgi:hypothetical protein